ncbi:MAG: tetratricopeptide repeat protein [Holophagales bacterium]|nr:tetratricopeptide repeat protein [Holophagales bacterium]
MQKKISAVLPAAVLVALVAAYLPVLRSGFIWNDHTYVTENPTLDGLAGLARIWTDPSANEQYYPLVFTSYWIEKRLWGLHPLGYHLVNVLLHAAAAFLLWRFLRRLALPAAGLAATVFALHPVCVESVAWVTERKNTLSLVLVLLSAHAWRASRDALAAREARQVSKKKRARPEALPLLERPALLYAVALAAFTLALLAKTTASVLPAVLLVLVWWMGGRLRASDVRPLLPFFAVGIALSPHGLAGADHGPRDRGRMGPRSPGARRPRRADDDVLRGQDPLAGRPLFHLPQVGARRREPPAVAARPRLDGRARGRRAACAPGAAGTARRAAALRRCPLPGHGVLQRLRDAVLVGRRPLRLPGRGRGGGERPVRSSDASRASPRAMAPVGGGFATAGVFVLAALTFRQGRAYRNEETLWQHTLERNADCFICLTNYGNLLLEAGKTDEALPLLTRSLAIKPDALPTLLNLARVAEERGRFEEAAYRLRSALAVEPEDGEVRVHLATIYTKAGRLEDAIRQYREALRVPSQEDFLAHNGIGVALVRSGRPAEGVEHLRACVQLRPDYTPCRANLEAVLQAAGSR